MWAHRQGPATSWGKACSGCLNENRRWPHRCPMPPGKLSLLHILRPFTYKGRAYQRIESVTSVMPQDKYNHRLMQRGGKYSWEAMPNPDLQVSDLDENVIIGAVRAGINCGRLPETTIREEIPAILEKFDLLHDGKLNNAAAVLFGRNLYDLSLIHIFRG